MVVAVPEGVGEKGTPRRRRSRWSLNNPPTRSAFSAEVKALMDAVGITSRSTKRRNKTDKRAQAQHTGGIDV